MVASASDRQKFLSHGDAQWIFVGLATLAALRCVQNVIPWMMTQWAFSYEYAFVKRGLVGELARHVFSTLTPTIVNCLSWAIMLILIAALVRTFMRPALATNRTGAWMFATVAVTHSATVPYILTEIGRFDHPNLLILLACLFVVRKASSLLRFVLIPLLCAIGLLIHEAFFLMFLPLVFAAWFYEEPIRVWPKLGILLLLALLVLVIGEYGVPANIAETDYIALLQSRNSIPIKPDAVDVLYRGFADNLSYNAAEFMRNLKPNLTHHFVLVLTLLPSIIFFRKLMQALVADASAVEVKRLAMMICAALAPLGMYLLATDCFRWWAIAITNVFIVFAYLAMRDDNAIRLADAIERNPVIVAFVVGTSLVFGPLGVMTSSYPDINLWFLPYWKFSWS